MGLRGSKRCSRATACGGAVEKRQRASLGRQNSVPTQVAPQRQFVASSDVYVVQTVSLCLRRELFQCLPHLIPHVLSR